LCELSVLSLVRVEQMKPDRLAVYWLNVENQQVSSAAKDFVGSL
jgi:hypothetical protein